VESGLLWCPDFLPQRAVDGDHAAAEHWAQAIEIFGVVVGVGHQHALGVGRLA